MELYSCTKVGIHAATISSSCPTSQKTSHPAVPLPRSHCKAICNKHTKVHAPRCTLRTSCSDNMLEITSMSTGTLIEWITHSASRWWRFWNSPAYVIIWACIIFFLVINVFVCTMHIHRIYISYILYIFYIPTHTHTYICIYISYYVL